MSNKILKSEHEKIIHLFLNGMYQKDIAQIYGVSNDAIRWILRTNNIGEKDRPHRLDKEKVISMYNAGSSCADIAKLYNIDKENIRYWLNKWGIQRRHNIYTCDEYYFDNIDSPEKAYYLGLLYADGYHNVRHNTVTITLQENDSAILQSLNDAIKNTRPLRFVEKKKENAKWKNCYQFNVISSHMSEMLEQHGLVQAKSLTLNFPNWLDKSLYSHFIRGYFDGDGHISKGKYHYNISLIGTENFLTPIKEIFENDLGVETHMYISCDPQKPTRTLMITKKDMSKIVADWLYQDANTYIQRKYDVYKLKYCSSQKEENINNISIDVAN